MPKISIRTVNNALASLGAKEYLVKGKDYFYFCGGDSFRWKSTSVYVKSLNQLTLEQWVNEYLDLRKDIPEPSESIVTHSAYQRGPDSTKFDARCGVWFPKQVSRDVNAITCKSCLKLIDSDIKNFGDIKYTSEGTLC